MSGGTGVSGGRILRSLRAGMGLVVGIVVGNAAGMQMTGRRGGGSACCVL